MGNVVSENVRHAYAALQADRRRVLRLAAAPSVLIIVSDLLPYTNPHLSHPAEILAFTAYVILAVRIHRHILLSDAGNENTVNAMLHFKFGIWVVLLALFATALVLPAMLLGTISPFVLPLALVPLIYFVARASLVLPDRALGGSTPFDEVWSWSIGNGWKLGAVLFVPPLLINLVIVLATISMPTELRQLISAFASIPVLIFEVALLSCAYRGLRKLVHAG